MTQLPLFPVTKVGSWPRSREFLRALRDRQHKRTSAEQFDAIADKAVLEALHTQETVSVDIVTDGEQRRDNFYSFVAKKLEGSRIGVHICRGNWSVHEEVLLHGSYTPLMPHLDHMKVDQLVHEYATPRAGEIEPFDSQHTTKELGLGVANPRTEEVEPAQAIVTRVQEALRFMPPNRIFLNPDCGFGTFSSRPMNTPELAARKLSAMSQAAAQLRGIG